MNTSKRSSPKPARVVAAAAAPNTGGRCAPGAESRRVALPVLSVGGARTGAVKPSRNGRRRALVLIGVHVLVLIHVLLWLRFGRTLSPVEPSESMYTLETGVVNAGFIFFIVAIVSTLIFGRFFCGWACHVVALQDLCAWMLRRVGVRPRPFRSRLLVFVPLFFALYMFVWPTFRREALAPALRRWWPEGLSYLGHVHPFPGFSNGLIVENFWGTFPGPWIAIPFLFVCGFVCVYFLGAKGFCTYGCPYGGFFAPADKVSPGRIIVDHDRCEGCGHCTAVCTSNVRVHEEIRDFGMVVDPGCMKCMDCVSVCPNEALSFGFGAPPVAKSTKRGRTGPAREGRRAGATRTFDLSWPEEVAVAAVFVASFVIYRALYDAVPMLMAIGVAGCVSFVAWKAWRLPFERNVRLHNFQLRLHGRVRPWGWAFAVFALLVIGVTAQGAAVRVLLMRAGAYERQVHAPIDVVLSGRSAEIPPEELEAARRAARLHRLASPVWEGGIALASTPSRKAEDAFVRAVIGDYAGAERSLRTLVARTDMSENGARHIATMMALQGRAEEGFVFLVRTAEVHPDLHGLRAEVTNNLAGAGRIDEAERVFRSAMERRPGDGVIVAQRAGMLLALGRVEEGLREARRATEVDPRSAPARMTYAAALLVREDIEGAIEQLKVALELDPFDPMPAIRIAQALHAAGRIGEAGPYLDIAEARRAARAQRAPESERHAPSGTTVTRD